jgi:hypothetical protein
LSGKVSDKYKIILSRNFKPKNYAYLYKLNKVEIKNIK